jgi:hypothetical protein
MISVSGCYTIEGVDRDIARGGEEMQDPSHQMREQGRGDRDREDRQYQAARSACDGLAGIDRTVCIDRAQVRNRAHINDARRTYPRSGTPAESEEDRFEDPYDAARDRCEALHGADEERCMADARARYRR